MGDHVHDFAYGAVLPKPNSRGVRFQHRRCSICGGVQVAAVCAAGRPCVGCVAVGCSCVCHTAAFKAKPALTSKIVFEPDNPLELRQDIAEALAQRPPRLTTIEKTETIARLKIALAKNHAAKKGKP